MAYEYEQPSKDYRVMMEIDMSVAYSERFLALTRNALKVGPIREFPYKKEKMDSDEYHAVITKYSKSKFKLQ